MSNAIKKTEEPNETTALVSMVERLALNPDVDVDKLDRLLNVQERILSKQAETDFSAAMTQAQSEIGRVAADKRNNQTHSDYASYAALDRVIRPVYTKHGFSLSFDTGDGAPEGHIRVVCYVAHRGGHSRTYHADMPADGKGAKGGDVMTKTHAAGSAMQYGMRYLLKMIFNVAIGKDDDGNAAGAEPISEEQLETLEALVKEVKADRKGFLKYCQVERLADLPAVKYDAAVRSLERKRADS